MLVGKLGHERSNSATRSGPDLLTRPCRDSVRPCAEVSERSTPHGDRDRLLAGVLPARCGYAGVKTVEREDSLCLPGEKLRRGALRIAERAEDRLIGIRVGLNATFRGQKKLGFNSRLLTHPL